MKIKKNSLNNIVVLFALLLSSFSYTMDVENKKAIILYKENERELKYLALTTDSREIIKELDNILEQEDYTDEDKQKLVELFSNFVAASPFDKKIKHDYYKKISLLVHPDKNSKDKERYGEFFGRLNCTNTLMRDSLEDLASECEQPHINTKIIMMFMTQTILNSLGEKARKNSLLSSFGYRAGSMYSGLLVRQPKAFCDAIRKEVCQIQSLSDEIEKLLKQTNQKQSSAAT